VLSEQGTSWEAVGASVIENKTRENMERIFKSAKANGYDVFISPHYFYQPSTAVGHAFCETSSRPAGSASCSDVKSLVTFAGLNRRAGLSKSGPVLAADVAALSTGPRFRDSRRKRV
jgi:hypothetical protein